eukprot:CAMPEP_0115440298 /NCGR_PEP_ID=MMETSP0271-20121206/36224_1 /TAXON_ID=71861 /ORGANISM="Scrippsiella trochoidea, Strain CCMP3099" /LENGTH=68 /DNA_ID=CAMNT_0002866025 /DNA_START=313 /DNA_END=517 /DNA_ORIENTATION=-
MKRDKAMPSHSTVKTPEPHSEGGAVRTAGSWEDMAGRAADQMRGVSCSGQQHNDVTFDSMAGTCERPP